MEILEAVASTSLSKRCSRKISPPRVMHFFLMNSGPFSAFFSSISFIFFLVFVFFWLFRAMKIVMKRGTLNRTPEWTQTILEWVEVNFMRVISSNQGGGGGYSIFGKQSLTWTSGHSLKSDSKLHFFPCARLLVVSVFFFIIHTPRMAFAKCKLR